MILTHCATCAAPLAHDAPRCVRCETRYCDATCAGDHWRRGHKFFCKTIQSGGGAEQFHADGNYEEAVAVAVEACADDTAGQTCYICYGEGEDLVRGCSCRGTAGVAHVSCLARQAQVAVERSEDFQRWHTCGLCEQNYHGVVSCALGWACWKTYVGRPEMDGIRISAMSILGNGLYRASRFREASSVQEAGLSTKRRFGASEEEILMTLGNTANSYESLGQFEHCLRMRRDAYSGWMRLNGEEYKNTILAANNYARSLVDLRRFEEARAMMRKTMPVARRVLGESHESMLRMWGLYARAFYQDPAATLGDLREAAETLEDTERTARRVLGGAHPLTVQLEKSLQNAQAALRARETPSPPA